MSDAQPEGLLRRNAGSSVQRVGRAMRITVVNFFRKPVTVHYPDRRAAVSRSLSRPARADLRQGNRRGELHRLPPVRVRLPAGGDQGRDAEGREAQLRQDLHARAVRVRVLRAVRPGLPDRRHRDDEVVRPGDRRSARDAARQGSAARHRPAAPSRRGPRATCCATCRRRRRRRKPRSREAGTGGDARRRRAHDARSRRLLGVRRRPRRLRPRGRAEQESLSLPSCGSRSRSSAPPASSCCSTPSSSPPCRSCSTPAASSPSSSSHRRHRAAGGRAAVADEPRMRRGALVSAGVCSASSCWHRAGAVADAAAPPLAGRLDAARSACRC